MAHMFDVQEDLWDAIDAGGDSAAYAFLERAVADGRLPQVVYEHILAWNHFKQTEPVYVLAHALYVNEHLSDWARDGLPEPDPEHYDMGPFGSLELDITSNLDINLGPGAPVRVNRQGRNEPCACGSGRKYKVCHGRHQ